MRCLQLYKLQLFDQRNIKSVQKIDPNVEMTTADESSIDFESSLFPQETWYEQLIRYGLYVGAAFQLICILAVIVFPPSSTDQSEDHSSVESDDSEVSDTETASASTVKQGSKKRLEKKKRR